MNDMEWKNKCKQALKWTMNHLGIVLCVIVIFMILGTLIYGVSHRLQWFQQVNPYDDGIVQVDLDTIYFSNSKVEVNFSEVLLSDQKEQRKLIVSEQEGTINTMLTNRMIQGIDLDILKKSQNVQYTGKTYFVVDLDNLTAENIVQDKEHHVVTIKIDHAYMETVVIDPDKVTLGQVKQGLLNRGDIQMTMQDYNALEKELISTMTNKFDTASNGQIADENAISMVKKIYEPIVKAVDDRYSVRVEFK